MAIPIEFSSVVIRKGSLSSAFPGGLDAFFDAYSFGPCIEDEHLVRASFMSTHEALNLVDWIDARCSDVPEGSLAAIVDLNTTSPQLPAWLEVGTVSGLRCVWLAGTEAGLVAAPPRYLSARPSQVSLAAFRESLRAHDIILDPLSKPGSYALSRAGTRIESVVVVDGGMLTGILTFLPEKRLTDPHGHNGLLTDVDAALRGLGWDGSS